MTQNNAGYSNSGLHQGQGV